MSIEMKVRKVGNSLGVLLPKDALSALGVAEGDAVYAVPGRDGLLLRPYDPKFAAAMEFADDYLRQNRDAFHELSKR